MSFRHKIGAIFVHFRQNISGTKSAPFSTIYVKIFQTQNRRPDRREDAEGLPSLLQVEVGAQESNVRPREPEAQKRQLVQMLVRGVPHLKAENILF
jgi:hypothetical protein